ncbi:CLUMA_CG002172, isoform A [Clunio marinus]|uniref:CLUMA_CG002172, isoform A n=1 Tax=Clunio marinus TaxID=568069 RepID=A0A1J1HKE1_9DIPT|nr:CLUMA_CG002172, isoform A [Clunio marinus]
MAPEGAAPSGVTLQKHNLEREDAECIKEQLSQTYFILKYDSLSFIAKERKLPLKNIVPTYHMENLKFKYFAMRRF